jgi:hypothetical protein
MKRKLIFTLSLIGLFLMWGVFGFVAAPPRTEPVMHAAPEANPEAVPVATTNAAIPITGEAQSVTGIFLVYALFALGRAGLDPKANAANKLTIPYAYRRTTDQS